MQSEPNAKQLIVERIKSATNILVTVSRDPSVDELSAALGLTLMLNKMDKHATAVFSGAVPPAIEFLEPKKTFEDTTDSLRDFIIALDKEKADRLRYKVEEDVVRIFITPYRTKISEKDLNFSQGDFNVELIIALGVEKREDIDTAVTAHGRILHDATIVTVNAKNEQSSVGTIDWNDASSSSLCEMLMSLSEALQAGLLDQQISTALLTGIVSATDRFRNEHTSPKVMTMAAQLMAAGANQQLIATKLEETQEVELRQGPAADPKTSDGTTRLKEGESEKLEQDESPAPAPNGELEIVHEAAQAAEALPEAPVEPVVDEKAAEAELAARLETPPAQSIDDLRDDLLAAGDTTAPTEPAATVINDVKGGGSWRDRPTAAPTFGGTLNATVDEAEEEKRREELSEQNHTLLNHDASSAEPPQFDQPVSTNDESSVPEPTPTVEAPVTAIQSEPDSPLSYEPIPEPHEAPLVPEPPISTETTPVSQPPTLSELEMQAHANANEGVALDDARAAVDAALNALPFNPAGQPLQAVGAQPLGEDIRPSAEPVMETQPVIDQPVVEPIAPAPAVVESMPEAQPPAPAMPPLPDFSTLPPLPGDEQAPHPAMTDPSLSQDTAVTVPTDPSQFKIPGQ